MPSPPPGSNHCPAVSPIQATTATLAKLSNGLELAFTLPVTRRVNPSCRVCYLGPRAAPMNAMTMMTRATNVSAAPSSSTKTTTQPIPRTSLTERSRRPYSRAPV